MKLSPLSNHALKPQFGAIEHSSRKNNKGEWEHAFVLQNPTQEERQLFATLPAQKGQVLQFVRNEENDLLVQDLSSVNHPTETVEPIHVFRERPIQQQELLALRQVVQQSTMPNLEQSDFLKDVIKALQLEQLTQQAQTHLREALAYGNSYKSLQLLLSQAFDFSKTRP